MDPIPPAVRLHLGDCLAVMRDMEAGSISHILTDPPYGQSNERYDRGVDPAVWRECHRITGPDAALISFAGSPTYHRIASDIEAAGWKVRQMWAWVYRDGMMTTAYPKEGFDRLAPAMDPIVYATKGKVLLRLQREGDPWKATRNVSGFSSRSVPCRDTSATGHYPRSITSDGSEGWEYFDYSRTNGYRCERVGHPNQKPLALMRWLVAKLPRSDHPILDPYAGSATTLVAAQAEGFAAIGIEVDPDFHTLGSQRLAAERARTPLLA